MQMSSLENIELSSFMWTNAEMGLGEHINPLMRYELECVVVHIGSSHCGHYYTLRKVNNHWFEVLVYLVNIF